MKKNWTITLFTIIYISTFSFIYAYLFNYLKGYILILLLFMIINIPSLLSVLFLLIFERYKTKTISVYIYLVTAFGLTSVLLINWKKLDGDPKNIFPIFEENAMILITICASAYLIAFLTSKLIIKLKTKHA